MEISYLISGVLAIVSVYFFVSWRTTKEKLLGTRELLDKIESVRDETLIKKEEEHKSRITAETEIKLLEQKNESILNQMKEWEKLKDQHLEAARASVLKAGSEMSSKLLDDHKRESESNKKESEKRIKDTTEELHKEFKSVFESVNSLSDQVKKSDEASELIKHSLLSPAGAGSISEITLENIFKASGLIENRDYIMQYWARSEDGKGSRPDAIVFLPGNDIMVVDSKASKFFLEIGRAKGNREKEKELELKLKVTMKNHLNDLKKRDYKQSVKDQLSKSERIGEINNINVLMFLPSEYSIERLITIDEKFWEKACKENIIPVGPSGLVNMLLHSKMMISNEKQEKNHQLIVDEMKNLLGSVAKLYELSGSMGKTIKIAFEKYDKFAGSFNSNFLSKVKKLDNMGLAPQKDRDMPKLERYQVIKNQIEVESEELSEIIKEIEVK